MKKEHSLYAAAMGIGVLTWAVIAGVSGRSEAWDSGMYFAVAIPIIGIIAAFLAYFEPKQWWPLGVDSLCCASGVDAVNVWPRQSLSRRAWVLRDTRNSSADHSSARTLAEERVVLSSSA
ncbi:MAG: hypothetical protein ACREV0_04475 [Burkholderiales bacterium]